MNKVKMKRALWPLAHYYPAVDYLTHAWWSLLSSCFSNNAPHYDLSLHFIYISFFDTWISTPKKQKTSFFSQVFCFFSQELCIYVHSKILSKLIPTNLEASIILVSILGFAIWYIYIYLSIFMFIIYIYIYIFKLDQLSNSNIPFNGNSVSS